MKRAILILLCSVFCSTSLLSQTLRGTVYDAKTGKPVTDARVYLDGTSMETIAGADGKFTLVVSKPINTTLVVDHILYEPYFVTTPFSSMPEKIYLKEKENILVEATVVADRFTREQKLQAFREQFLGTNKAGKSCRILNEDDISFSYNSGKRTLNAQAVKPIVVENSYLGYTVEFTLMEFSAQFNDNTLRDKSIYKSMFYGTSLYVDENPNDKKIKERRVNTYKESSTCFFRSLVNGTLKETKHRLYFKGLPTSTASCFAIKDTLQMKQLVLHPSLSPTLYVNGEKKTRGLLTVLYKRSKQTDIVFYTDVLYVDSYGNTDGVGNIMYTGAMSEQRLGSMLPLDYSPAD